MTDDTRRAQAVVLRNAAGVLRNAADEAFAALALSVGGDTNTAQVRDWLNAVADEIEAGDGADVIATGWDANKARTHLANLRESQESQVVIRDAFLEAADRYDRQAAHLGRQIEASTDLFSKPRTTEEAS